MMRATTPESLVRVLIVDDSAMMRESLDTILSTSPKIKVVGQASSGEEALTLTSRLLPDVVLMDVNMPEMDGLVATRRLKQGSPECEVLMLTSHAEQNYLREALRSGASGYVLKDSDQQGLIEAVLTVASGGSLIHPAMLRSFISELAHLDNANPGVQTQLLNQLTRREREVLTLIGSGLNNATIAERLNISLDTVKSHVRAVLEKLEVEDRTQAAVLAMRLGLVS